MKICERLFVSVRLNSLT